jgi:hypothetical protein
LKGYSILDIYIRFQSISYAIKWVPFEDSVRCPFLIPLDGSIQKPFDVSELMPKNEWEAILKWVKHACIDSLILSLSDADFTSCRPWLSGSEPDTKPMLIALLKWSDYMLAPTMKTYATRSILAHRDFHAAEILYLALNCDVKD